MSTPAEAWSSFTYDPRDPRYAGLRASDQDRALANQVLDEAYADGRLDRQEYDERCARAASLRVLGELRSLLDDLIAPPPDPRRALAHATQSDLEQLAEKSWRSRRRDAAFTFLATSLVSTAIWFATGFFGGGGFDPSFFWPAFIIAFSLLHLARVAGSHGEIVDSEIRRLEKQRAKEQRGRRGPFG